MKMAQTAHQMYAHITWTTASRTELIDRKIKAELKTIINKAAEEEGYEIIAIEQIDSSTDLSDFIPDKNKKYALVFGNEIKGVSQNVLDIVDLCLEIPQFGTKHSFNISVSAGIVLWHMYLSKA